LGSDERVRFERVFGSEETKDVLIGLLNAVLSPPAGREVVPARSLEKSAAGVTPPV
jgi:hypothetical protein